MCTINDAVANDTIFAACIDINDNAASVHDINIDADAEISNLTNYHIFLINKV